MEGAPATLSGFQEGHPKIKLFSLGLEFIFTVKLPKNVNGGSSHDIEWFSGRSPEDYSQSTSRVT